MNTRKAILTVLVTALNASIVLCIPATIPAFRWQGLANGMIMLPFLAVFSFSGPFASAIFDIPVFHAMWLGWEFLVAIVAVLGTVLAIHFKSKDRVQTGLMLATAIWIACGAYYTTLGAWLSI